MGLIDRSHRFVALVSPFVRPWPELDRALARAVLRGVAVSLVTRPPRGTEVDTRIFDELEFAVEELPRLHLKAYLSES